MKRTQDIRVGVIGLGPHIIDHLEPSKALGFRLVAAYDTSLPNAEAAVATLELNPKQVNIYTDLQQFLQEVEADVILIGSPDEFHATQLLGVIQALIARGLHTTVMVEKPLATSSIDLMRVQSAFNLAAQAGIVITSCHIREFDPPYRRVIEQLPTLVRKYGRLTSLKLDFAYPQPKPGSWKKDRSLLLDHASHEMLFMLRLLGIGPFTVTQLHDGPLGYRAKRMHGSDQQAVAFEFCGSRTAPRSSIGRGSYPETITLAFRTRTVVVLTHSEARVEENVPQNAEIILLKTDYDRRLLGVMNNIASVITEGQSYLDPKLLLLITQSVVLLKLNGSYQYAPRG